VINGDQLFNLERQLDRIASEEPGKISEFYNALRNIYESQSYQDYLNRESVAVHPYQVDENFGEDISFDVRNMLDWSGLLNGSILEARIDDHMGRIHLTDGPWVPASYRVYPYSDESAAICSYIKDKGYHIEADLLIDPASGCGHHGLGLPEIPAQAYYDVNPRAAIFCRINSILAGAQRMQSGLNDLRDGMPLMLRMVKAEYALVTVNMPFAIYPKGNALPGSLAQDGGDRGAALTFAALEAVKEWADNSPHVSKMRLVLLFYSLGDGKVWEVAERAEELLGVQCDTRLLTGERMWRVNGAKAQDNPMPLSAMVTKANCLHTYSAIDQDDARDGYLKLQALYERSGYTHLGYGLLDALVKG